MNDRTYDDEMLATAVKLNHLLDQSGMGIDRIVAVFNVVSSHKWSGVVGGTGFGGYPDASPDTVEYWEDRLRDRLSRLENGETGA